MILYTDQSGILPLKNQTYGFQYFRDNVSDRLKNSLNNEIVPGPEIDGKKRDWEGWKIIDP